MSSLDTNQEFIKMLDKAIESFPLAFKDFDRTRNIQSQLQEMLSDDFIWQTETLKRWYAGELSNKFTNKTRPMIFSMEQLWFTIVMHKKFNKTWNGNDWIELPKPEGK